VEKDLNKAIPLFMQAAEQGNKQVHHLSLSLSLAQRVGSLITVVLARLSTVWANATRTVTVSM
jgi:TPR repeat protein